MKSFLLESTLNTKERNSIPSEMFGLPRDRKYPLIDESHVRKAIQFFKFAPSGKRSELANNINRRAKELKMTINVSKDSAFYNYREKEVVIESLTTPDESALIFSENGIEDVQKALHEVRVNFSLFLSTPISDLMSSGLTDSLLKIEDDLAPIFNNRELNQKILHQIMNVKYFINPFTIINNVIHDSYKDVLKFIEYTTNIDMTMTRMLYEIIEDLFYCMLDNLKTSDKIGFMDKLEKLENITVSFPCNLHHISRKLTEFIFACNMDVVEYLRAGSTDEFVAGTELQKYAIEKLNAINENIMTSGGMGIIIINPDVVNRVLNVLQGTDMNLINMKNYLCILKNELKSEIDIILMSINSVVRDNQAETMFYQLGDLIETDGKGTKILNIITYLEGAIDEDNVKLYNNALTLKLDGTDIIIFNKLNRFDRMFIGKDCNGDPVYYGVSKDVLYLLVKAVYGSNEYYLLMLYSDGVSWGNENNFVCPIEYFDKSKKLKAIRVTPYAPVRLTNTYNFEALTEGFYIDADGNMKFKFNPKKSYMDEYAENHKILIENSKAKNYEGMKGNLAFIFAMINQIERDVIHSDKPSKHTREFIDTATKARMFLINDFKTYMKELMEHEQNFDFTKYYESSDYGKLVVSVTTEEIAGFKKLFRVLMLS